MIKNDEPPCKDCIVFGMCKNRADEMQRYLSDVEDIGCIIVRCMSDSCILLRKYLYLTPEYRSKHKTNHIIKVAKLMKLSYVPLVRR